MTKSVYEIQEGRIANILFAPDDFTPRYPLTDKEIPEELQKDGVVLGWSWSVPGFGWYDASDEDRAAKDKQRDAKIADLTQQLTDAKTLASTQAATIADLQTVADSVPALKKQLAMLVMANAKTATDTTETEAE